MEEDHSLALGLEHYLRRVLPLALHFPHNRVVNFDMTRELELAILVGVPELHTRPVVLVLPNTAFFKAFGGVLLYHLFLTASMEFDRHKL